jgi:hypothetical protein
MRMRFTLNMALEIFSGLELKDIMKCSTASRYFYELISKVLVSRILSLQSIVPTDLSTLNCRTIYRLFKHYHYKKLVVFRSLEYFEDSENSVSMNFKIPFYPGIAVELVEFSMNYVIIKTMRDSVYHLTYFRNFYDRFNGQFALPDFSKSFVQIANMKEFSLKSKNFIFLDNNDRMQIRFYSNQDHVKDELQLPLEPCLQKFLDEDVETRSIFVCEQYLVFITKRNTTYLVEGFNSLSPENIINKKVNVFKIEMDNEIKFVSLSNTNLFLLTKEGQVFILPLNKSELSDRLIKYNTNKNASHLTLQPSCCMFLRSKQVRSIFCFKNLFIFEEEKIFKRFEDFTTDEVCSFLQDIEIKGLDKTIKYNNIDGSKLALFDDKEMERMFALGKHGGKLKLLDEITIRKIKKVPEPILYLFGSNSLNQFGISQELNYIVEIDVPKFDPNETISSFAIGFYNCVFLTNNGRSMIAAKNIEADSRKRRLSSNVEIEENDKGSKKKGKNDKKIKNDKKEKKDKNMKVDSKKGKEKQKQTDKKKFDWLDLKDYLSKHQVPLRSNEVISSVQAHSKYFYLVVSEVYEEENKFLFYFKDARDFLSFARERKNFESQELLFFHEVDQKYYPYKTMLAFDRKLSDIKLIKCKKDNSIVWSRANPYFDIRSVIN